MERLTIPDVRIDENTIRRTIIDAEKVKECAMEFYWRLKEIEDVIADGKSKKYNLDRLRELLEACKGLEPSEIAESKLLIATRKDPDKLARMAELVEADRDGRVKIHPKPNDNTCGSCGHFHRIAGRRCGTCDVQSKYRDKYGREDDRRGTYTPSQSRKACRKYVPGKGAENGQATM